MESVYTAYEGRDGFSAVHLDGAGTRMISSPHKGGLPLITENNAKRYINFGRYACLYLARVGNGVHVRLASDIRNVNGSNRRRKVKVTYNEFRMDFG